MQAMERKVWDRASRVGEARVGTGPAGKKNYYIFTVSSLFFYRARAVLVVVVAVARYQQSRFTK